MTAVFTGVHDTWTACVRPKEEVWVVLWFVNVFEYGAQSQPPEHAMNRPADATSELLPRKETATVRLHLSMAGSAFRCRYDE
jgi:hypothetical protein